MLQLTSGTASYRILKGHQRTTVSVKNYPSKEQLIDAQIYIRFRCNRYQARTHSRILASSMLWCWTRYGKPNTLFHPYHNSSVDPHWFPHSSCCIFRDRYSTHYLYTQRHPKLHQSSGCSTCTFPDTVLSQMFLAICILFTTSLRHVMLRCQRQ